MKRAFDFDLDKKKVLSKARVKYADYDVSAAAGVSVGKQEDPTAYCYFLLADYSNAVGKTGRGRFKFVSGFHTSWRQRFRVFWFGTMHTGKKNTTHKTSTFKRMANGVVLC